MDIKMGDVLLKLFPCSRIVSLTLAPEGDSKEVRPEEMP
jgi:hypothetical protein